MQAVHNYMHACHLRRDLPNQAPDLLLFAKVTHETAQFIAIATPATARSLHCGGGARG
jgi:hypothetical protein